MRIPKSVVSLVMVAVVVCGVLSVPVHGAQEAKTTIYGPHWSVPLSVKMQEEILDAWNQRFEASNMTKFQFSYYGMVGEYVVLARSYMTPIGTSSVKVYVYRDGNFGYFQDAYENGEITEEQRELIRNYLTTQNALTAGAATEIKTAFANANAAKIETLSIRYFGEYEGCHVAFVDSADFSYSNVLDQDAVAGYTFHYSSGQKLQVYKDGEILTLVKAYEEGWLSDEAVSRLWNYYANGKIGVPETGDTVLIPALAVLLLSGMGLAALTVRRKKNA